MMIYQGKPGMWQEWLEFQAQQKRNREAAKKEAEAKARKRKKLIKDIAIGTAVTVGALSAVGLLIYVLSWVVTTKGK